VAVWVGDFSGRPMNRVSGITGAGPLLHRAIMVTADRYSPGVLPTPENTGSVAVSICLLSGLRAGPYCPHKDEWFAPGTAPEQTCNWHQRDGVVLPAMYRDWSGQENLSSQVYAAAAAPPDSSGGPFRILSPANGDRYQVPPGVEGRYATISLQAHGGKGGSVHWAVNGQPYTSSRWTLTPGTTTFVAQSTAGEADTVSVQVTGN
jgi:penicillin-binding protein 1C